MIDRHRVAREHREKVSIDVNPSIATPIFIVGVQRSGTTWLANQLSAHSQIAGVQDMEFGTRESLFFSYFAGRYGDLTNKANYIEFVEVFSATDYFEYLGGAADDLYALWPASYAEVFRHVMDDLAHRRGAAHWLEKSPDHTVYISEIAEAYPDAVFIAIRRDVLSVTQSRLVWERKLMGRLERTLFILKSVYRWTCFYKIIHDFAARNPARIHIVEYQAMRSDKAVTLQHVCEFLNIPFEERLASDQYAPNTSYREKQPNKGLFPAEKQLIRVAAAALQLVPTRILLRVFRSHLKKRWLRGPLPLRIFRNAKSAFIDPEELSHDLRPQTPQRIDEQQATNAETPGKRETG